MTGKHRWPLNVVKWWGGWGEGDDVNTILRYLLEETSRYEKNFMHYMYTKGSDISMFNNHVTSLADIGKEVQLVQNCVTQRLSQIEQATAAHRLLVSEDLTKFSEKMDSRVAVLCEEMKKVQECLRGMVPSSSTGNENSDSPMNTNNSIQSLGEPYSHIPSVGSWREVIQQWLEGCPEKKSACTLVQLAGTITDEIVEVLVP